MTLRWTRTAVRDIESLHAYVAGGNPEAATVVINRVVTGIERLLRHPDLGRNGRVPGTRELIVAPYIVAYRAKKTAIEILAVIHSARRWPDSF